MPEVSPNGRNRWYRVKWPDERQLKPAWAEKYFDSHSEAFARRGIPSRHGSVTGQSYYPATVGKSSCLWHLVRVVERQLDLGRLSRLDVNRFGCRRLTAVNSKRRTGWRR